MSADLRRAVFDPRDYLHPGFFEDNYASEIQSRITTDTTLLQTVIGSSVSIALRNALMFLGGLVLLVLTNPRLSLFVVIAAPLVVAPIILFRRRVRRLSRDAQDSIAHVGSYLSEALRQIKTVQAYTHEAIDQARFKDHVEAAFRVSLRRVRLRATLITLVMVLVLGAIAGMLWVGGQDVLAGRTTPGELAAFIFYALLVAGSVGAISEVLADLQRAAGATERLLELLEAKSALPVPEAPTPLPQPIQGRLAIEGLTFAYPTRRGACPEDLSLAVAPGKPRSWGPSGAGKSTLFDLLLRFYDPNAGRLMLDGQALPALDPRDLRSQFASFRRMRCSLRAPFSKTLPMATHRRHAVRWRRRLGQPLQRASSKRCPRATTRSSGKGVRLSGGQRQRVAIAQQLRNPRVLLLDEATSALDAQSEFEVQQALDRLARGRTTLVIAHRLATVRNVDRIVVLDEGQIVAEGTHEALLAENPLYRRLATLQFGASGAIG